MPGSLLSPPRSRVSRNESTRSDHSDGSNTSQSSAAGKKVSFSKAVRVKKYARPKKGSVSGNGDLSVNGNGVTPGSPEKRFWFKVYKNKHRQAPDPKELRGNDVIYYDNDPGGDAIRYNEDGDIISYHPNPSPLNYPVLTSECGTQTQSRNSGSGTGLYSFEPTDLHPSQMPTEPPHVKRDHVKKIVNLFNEEAVLGGQRSSDGDMSPPSSPQMYHSTPIKTQRIPTPPPEPPLIYSTATKSKKNPIVNGVKVIFGMGQLKKKDKSRTFGTRTNDQDLRKIQDERTDTYDLYKPTTNGKTRPSEKHAYKTEILISDGSDTEIKSPYEKKLDYGETTKAQYNDIVPTRPGGLFRHDEDKNDRYDDDFFHENGEEDRRRGKYHVETFDSGNQLVFDTTDVSTATTKLEKGEMFSTVGEKHQLWQNNKRIVVYEEPSPRIIRRKAKSQSDLTNSQDDNLKKVDKGVSTEQLSSRKFDEKESKKSKDSWLKLWRTTTKDKGVQCDKVPTSDDFKKQSFYGSNKYKIVKPRNGVVTAYSNVPSLEKLPSKSSKGDSSHVEEYNTSVTSSNYRNGDIYSQIDKSKKKKNDKKKNFVVEDRKNGTLFKSRSEPLYIGPPPKGYRKEEYQNSYYDDEEDRTIKTSKRSFGFRLNTGGENIERRGFRNNRPVYREENWYDVDDDVEAVEKQRNRGLMHHDIAEVRHEIVDDEFASDLSSSGERNGECPGSVMREVDYKKQEISYENVPRSDGESNLHASASAGGSGLWFREADEDYRKEMAQNEVSYPAGSHVGSDRFHTISRTDKVGKQKPPPSPRAFTLDKRLLKDKKKVNNSTGVKILVNGKEVSEKSNFKKKGKSRKSRISGEDPSSVQSDPLYVRGGLAAAYQARQRAAVRRSNSSVAGMDSNYRLASPVVRRRYRGTSEVSGASSETETAHSRKPLVMYIPGISHPERSPEEGDRSSGVNVARSQSMMTSSRPSRIIPRASKSQQKSSKQDLYRNSEFYEEDEIMPLASDRNKKKPPKVPYDSKKDIKRRHSMPKDTKFTWLKWKIRGKPSRQP